MIPDTDKAYIAGLFDVKVVSILLNDQKRKRNTKVRVIEYLSHNVLVWK